MKGVNIFLADGFEDCEALAVNDVLRRGGVDSRLVSINGSEFVFSSHHICVKADDVIDFSEYQNPSELTTADDFMIFPGGMPGSKRLAACNPLISLMKEHYASGGSLAAICAAPGLVLSQLSDDLSGLIFTCFDGFEEYLKSKGASFEESPAVVCGRIVTGRSAGHAIAFGLEILRTIKGDEVMEKVKHAMFLNN